MSVIVEKRKCKSGFLGLVTLDRSQAINSLDLNMCKAMLKTLSEWRADPEISCIFIQGRGEKGFCAGGDIKLVREAIVRSQTNRSDFQYVIDFFSQEYGTDYQLTLVEKPIICWASGITMGGGMGIMQAASYRIVTETSVLAMPEISIGLYPDVGASYFLSKLPPGVGLFLGLTGARFGPHDAIELELADFYIRSVEKESILQQLVATSWTNEVGANHQIVTACLLKHKFQMKLRSTVSGHLHLLAQLSNAESIEEADSTLFEISKKSAWVAESYQNLKKGSPLSALIIFEYLKRSKEFSRKEIFVNDFNLSVKMSLASDFAEGVRAVLVDKDQKPQWKYKKYSDIPSEVISTYFEDPWQSHSNPALGAENPFLKLISSL